MLALVIALVLAPPPESPRVTKPGSTTRLFDTRDSARACVDAMAADLKAGVDENRAAVTAGSRKAAPTTKGAADEICDAGTLVKLAPLTQLGLVRTEEAYSLVRVVAGKNVAKKGWTCTADLVKSAADAPAEQEQQPPQADAAVATREQQEAQARTAPEEEEATVRRIYSDTKEALRQACVTFDQSSKLRDILAQAPTDGPRLDAYAKALEEQRNCLVMFADGSDAVAIEAARRLLGMIPPTAR
jgi:hypothetical protein